MKVVDLHPEELIDKLNAGSLTSAERGRLDAHLAQCSSCRFEIAVRTDLAEDISAFEERPQMILPGSELGERASREQRAPQVSRSIRPRSSRRFVFALLAAALVLSAGGAMAAVITGAVGGHWLSWSPESKRAVASGPVIESRQPAKPKRAVVPAVSAPAVQVAASASSAPVVAAASAAPGASVLTPPQVVARPSAPATVPPRRALSAAEAARSPAVGASDGVPAATGQAESPLARADAATLFAEANRARRDGNVDRAVGMYRSLQTRFPSSAESALSRALLAQLLLDRGNPEAALAGFDRYLSDGTSVLSAEALVGRARALEQLGKSTQAAAAWRLVQSRFPGSVHARLATKRLAALGMR